MNEKLQSQPEQLSVLKAKLEIYEKWHNTERHPEHDSASSFYPDDEIDLSELWNVIWQGKWKIMLITAIFALTSAVYSLSLPNIYKSEALLMPNSQESSSAGASVSGQLGGLASLAGINLASPRVDKTKLALQVLKSREFLYEFISSNSFKEEFFAAKGWDRKSNSIIYDDEIFNVNEKRWVRTPYGIKREEPSLAEVYKVFIEERLVVNEDLDSGMIRISISHYSPYFATNAVKKIINSINDEIKNRDVETAKKSIEYLTNEIRKTNISEIERIFFQLIEKHQKTLMLANVNDDYVFKVVDKAVVPEEKDSPSRAVICVIGTFLGLLLGVSVCIGSVLITNLKN